MDHSFTPNSDKTGRVHRMTTRSQSRSRNTENVARDNSEDVVNNDATSSNGASNNIEPIMPFGDTMTPMILQNNDPVDRSSERNHIFSSSMSYSVSPSVIPENVFRIMQSSNTGQIFQTLHVADLDAFLRDLPQPVIPISLSHYPYISIRKKPKMKKIPRNTKGKYIEYTDCVICLEQNVANSILEPCKHENMCDTCIRKLKAWTCPICRTHIKKIIVYV